MIKVYIGNPLKFLCVPLLCPNLGFQSKDTILFSEHAFKYLKRKMVEIESDPSLADLLLIPHNYFLIKEKKDFVQIFISISKKHGKKIVIFAYGDSDEDIDVPNSSKPGYPWENGYQESFYSQFKLDLGDPNRFEILGELVYEIYRLVWVYNHTRIHTVLKMSPVQFAATSKSGIIKHMKLVS